MGIQYSNCYDYPGYYDIAFAFRNISQEVDIIEKTIKKYARCDINKFLELACGPSPHMIELSTRGYKFTGLDTNENMLEYCRDKARKASVQAEFVTGSMTNFRLQEKVDYVFIALGSLYATSTNEIDSHFDSVANALNIGGLFLLDWCVQFEPAQLFSESGQSWEVIQDQTQIKTTLKRKPLNNVEQLFEERLDMVVKDGIETRILKSHSTKRAIYPQEFLLLVANRPDFEFIGWWNNWNLDRPLCSDNTSIFRPIALLRRI